MFGASDVSAIYADLDFIEKDDMKERRSQKKLPAVDEHPDFVEDIMKERRSQKKLPKVPMGKKRSGGLQKNGYCAIP
jgi:hypothetical protein